MLFLDISHKIEHYYQTTDVFEDCDIVSPSQSCIHDFATYTNFQISREKTLSHGTVLLSISFLYFLGNCETQGIWKYCTNAGKQEQNVCLSLTVILLFYSSLLCYKLPILLN